MNDEIVGSPDERPLWTDPARAAASAAPIDYAADWAGPFDEELQEDPGAPTAGVRNRRTEIARRAARGERNCDIAAALGYTQAWVSKVMKDPFVQSEIRRFRDALMETDAMHRLKLASPDAAERLHRAVLDPKDKGGLDASKFILEMTYGKPKQAVSVENTSLTAFTEMLKEMRSRGEVIDVTPQPEARSAEGTRQVGAAPDAPQESGYTTWIRQHRPQTA